jgi:glyoxylase I family protein
MAALNVDGPTQAELEKRIATAGLVEPQTYVLEHGYCRSVYAVDPDGMIVEFTRDADSADLINAARLKDAHSELKRWLAGDHTPNNDVRHFAEEGAH